MVGPLLKIWPMQPRRRVLALSGDLDQTKKDAGHASGHRSYGVRLLCSGVGRRSCLNVRVCRHRASWLATCRRHAVLAVEHRASMFQPFMNRQVLPKQGRSEL